MKLKDLIYHELIYSLLMVLLPRFQPYVDDHELVRNCNTMCLSFCMIVLANKDDFLVEDLEPSKV